MHSPKSGFGFWFFFGMMGWTLLYSQPLYAVKSAALIQIAVEVVELDERKTLQTGVDWIKKLLLSEIGVPSVFKVGAITRDRLFADLHAMQEDGSADLLANPKLVTRDGTTAEFKAGGEIPYAVAGSLGTSTVEFKPYGVNLRITPNLLSDGQIHMSLMAEVSGPDNQNATTLSGNVVPGIRSRQIQSTLTLEPGTTLTLAGLIQSEKSMMRSGLPILGKIPLLKYLFSKTVEVKKRSSIVVFVTPQILNMAALSSTGVSVQPAPSKQKAVEKEIETIERMHPNEPEEILRQIQKPISLKLPGEDHEGE